jgi:hypothetical protein
MVAIIKIIFIFAYSAIFATYFYFGIRRVINMARTGKCDATSFMGVYHQGR